MHGNHGRSQRRGPSAHQERLTEGEARNKVWRSLTPSNQLNVLDGRLGKSVGAKRQRARLGV